MSKRIIYLLGAVVLALPLLVTASAEEIGASSIDLSRTIAAPGNDNLVNATPVLAFPYSDTIADTASLELNEDICGNQQAGSDFEASAWYRYTPSQNGLLNATVRPNIDTVDLSLGLYTGLAIAPTHPLTNRVVCRDANGNGGAESFIRPVTAGTTYYIRVASRDTFGDYQVRMLDEMFVYLPLVLNRFPPSDWQAQDSGTNNTLRGISCPTTTTCVAVGDSGTVLTTDDGGSSWSSQSSGTISTLNEVNCINETRCVAVGDGGRVLLTSNGGGGWSSQNSNTNQVLRGVGCAVDTCLAVGGTGTSTGIFTSDGGDSWLNPGALGNTPLYGASCPNDGTCTAVGDGGRVLVFAGIGVKNLFNSLNPNRFESIDCVTDQACVIAGHSGVIYTTQNGGGSWTSRSSGTAINLEGVSCPTDQICYAVGDNGEIITSGDGGSNWSSQDTGEVTTNLNGVSCPTTTVCYAVGDGGLILGRK